MKIKSLFLSLTALLMLSCGASRKATTARDFEVIVPCSGLEYTSNSKFFRANGSGISNSLDIASQKAMTSARSSMAAAVEITVKSVTDNYLSSYEVNQDEEARGRFQSITREVANQTLNGVRVICKQTMQNKEGQYKSYVAIELRGDEIANDIKNKISADSKLRTDFEYQKFLQIFEAEMSKLEDEQ